LLDTLVLAFSFLLAWSARSATAHLDLRTALGFGLVALGVFLGVNGFFRLYDRLWRYASAGEIVVIAGAVATSTVLLTLTDLLWPDPRPAPLSVVWMAGLFSFVGFVSTRYRKRVWTGFQWRWRSLWHSLPPPRTRVLIVGAGEAGQLLAWRVQNQKEGQGYELVGFVDDDPNKHGMRLHGLPVLGDRHAIPALVSRYRVDLIVIAIYNISGQDFRAILDICEKTQVLIKVLPDVFEFLQATNGLPLVRNVTPEDLLGRKPVEVDRQACHKLLGGKTVLVTGAAGSIGSELCQQILSFAPRALLMVDNNESGLYDLTLTMQQARFARSAPEDAREQRIHAIIADVTDKPKMRVIFRTYRPDIVFHAAAYKHVPLMQEHPEEAVRVNVLGTWIVAELAAEYRAERFVLISTDKAVNPCSVMGATKRLCERIVASAAQGRLLPSNAEDRHTLFTAVRFGNVLGSRGSVVPTFERQIQQGGPVTVTHPEMTRYFMSVSEAVSLIIQAAVLTQGGDLFLLDMGQQILIDDLARRLIRLHGLRPEIDIPIVYTGPRPGEKLHEEPVAQHEACEPTPCEHIFRVCDPSTFLPDRSTLSNLMVLVKAQRRDELLARLWELVAQAQGSGNPLAKERGARTGTESLVGVEGRSDHSHKES
jgi:FlaA1/EpsC-like NDP-sugar epimerase